MFLDRQLQLTILKELQTAYPRTTSVQLMECFDDDRHIEINRNLFYLLEHGLIEGKVLASRLVDEPMPKQLPMVSITASGLDFLEADGGIGAILGKVVVKFDDEDLARLLRAIELSNATPEEKGRIKSILTSLSSEGLKNIYSHLVTLGLDNLPAAIRLIEKAVG